MDYLKKLPEEQAKLIIAIVERELFARGLLVEKEGKLRPTDVIHAIVGACAAPDTTTIIARNVSGKPEESYYFHTSRKMVVFHSIPVAGIHQFVALEDRTALTKSIFSLLSLGEVSVVQSRSGTVREEGIVAGRNAIENTESAEEILKASGLESEVAKPFAQALTNPSFSITFLHISNQQNGEGQEKTDGFSLLKGEDNNLWMLQPLPEQKVFIEQVDDRQIVQKIRSMLL